MTDSMSETKEWTLRPGVKYEFTINGSDHTQLTPSFKNLSKRYARNRALLREILLESDVVYHLLPEISIPQYGRANKNSVPRIHWHGVIKFPDKESIVQWLLVDAVKLAKYGSYQLNLFRPEHWVTYCRKYSWLFEDLRPNYELKNIDNLF